MIKDYNPHLGYKNDVVQENMKMVHKIARKYLPYARGSFGYEDIVSEAVIGLIKAFHKYDPERFDGAVTKFSTYAVPTIIGEIRRFLRDKGSTLKVPRSLYTLAGAIIKNDLTHSSVIVITKHLECSESEAIEALKYLRESNVASLDQSFDTDDDEGFSLQDTISCSVDHSEMYITEFMNTLSEREQHILNLRLVGKTQLQIADLCNLSQVQISRMLVSLGARLNQHLNLEKERKTNKMEIEVRIGERILKKNDRILLDDADGTRMQMVGFDTEKKMGYGLKLKRDGTADSRTVANADGWNITASFTQLKQSSSMEIQNNNQIVTRYATPDEAKKYGIRNSMQDVEWFVDENLPSNPTIGLSGSGLHLNALAVEKLKCTVGDVLKIGFNASMNRLVLVKDSEGVKIRKAFGENGSLSIGSKKLIAWLDKRKVARKRYVLIYDETANVNYVQLELK